MNTIAFNAAIEQIQREEEEAEKKKKTLRKGKVRKCLRLYSRLRI